MDQQPEAVEVPTPPVPPKKAGGKVLLILVTVVLVGGAAVAGATLGPKLLHPPAPAAAAEGEGEEHEAAAGEEAAEAEAESEPATPKGGPPAITTSFSSIVVDIRNGQGDLHHLKIGLSFELADKFTEDDFERWTPRGREAALTYLRTLDYESAPDPMRFEGIRKELCDRVKIALGKKNVRRVLVTDFVAQ